MPKPTFFNLPDSKRQAILEVARAEFAAQDFESASISHMVAQLGIAKGSFYQYFEDKEDLYLHVLEGALAERLAYVRTQFSADIPFFALVEKLLEAGLDFDLKEPQLSQILARALSSSSPLSPTALAQIGAPLAEFQRELLKRGANMGAIAPDIDLELAVVMLQAVMANVTAVLLQRNQGDPQAVRTALPMLMRILRDGLAAPVSPPTTGQ